jgi:hypothetical protein
VTDSHIGHAHQVENLKSTTVFVFTAQPPQQEQNFFVSLKDHRFYEQYFDYTESPNNNIRPPAILQPGQYAQRPITSES